MYTKLCDNDKDDIFSYMTKAVLFFCVYFLIEFIIVYNFNTSRISFLNMKSPTNGDTMNNNTVKSFMVFIYGIMTIAVLLWCGYKFHFIMPKMLSAYKNRPKPDNTLDKRFYYDCESNGVYEEESGNSVLKVFLKSDDLNKAFQAEFTQKTSGLKAPSMFAMIAKKMGEYKESLSKSIGEVGNNLSAFRKDISNISSEVKTMSGIGIEAGVTIGSSLTSLASTVGSTIASAGSTVGSSLASAGSTVGNAFSSSKKPDDV